MDGRLTELLTERSELREGERRTDNSFWKGGFGFSSERDCRAPFTASDDSSFEDSAGTARILSAGGKFCEELEGDWEYNDGPIESWCDDMSGRDDVAGGSGGLTLMPLLVGTSICSGECDRGKEYEGWPCFSAKVFSSTGFNWLWKENVLPKPKMLSVRTIWG